MNIHEIAAASKRNESLHFGVADGWLCQLFMLLAAVMPRFRSTRSTGAPPSMKSKHAEPGLRGIHEVENHQHRRTQQALRRSD